jgi:copper chaperone CopZ
MTCAHAVRVAISRFEGVEDVNVSLQRGHAQVKLKPANRVELNKVVEAVGHQALEVRRVSIIANGSVVQESDQKWWFAVGGTGERIRLKDPPPSAQMTGAWKVEFVVPRKSKTPDPAIITSQ